MGVDPDAVLRRLADREQITFLSIGAPPFVTLPPNYPDLPSQRSPFKRPLGSPIFPGMVFFLGGGNDITPVPSNPASTFPSPPPGITTKPNCTILRRIIG